MKEVIMQVASYSSDYPKAPIYVADLVRCKECRHWIGEAEYYENGEYKACWQLCGQYMNSEFWCKYGEREGE